MKNEEKKLTTDDFEKVLWKVVKYCSKRSNCYNCPVADPTGTCQYPEWWDAKLFAKILTSGKN